MFMKVGVVLCSVVAVSATAVMAQSDAISTRKALMKANGAQGAIGAKMLRGEEPFDLAKAKTIFATYQSDAAKFKDQFPEDSKTGDTAADPKIWSNRADFEAKLAKFSADAKEAEAKVTDLESFKAAFPVVQRNCGGCHETYRLKRS